MEALSGFLGFIWGVVKAIALFFLKISTWFFSLLGGLLEWGITQNLLATVTNMGSGFFEFILGILAILVLILPGMLALMLLTIGIMINPITWGIMILFRLFGQPQTFGGSASSEAEWKQWLDNKRLQEREDHHRAVYEAKRASDYGQFHD